MKKGSALTFVARMDAGFLGHFVETDGMAGDCDDLVDPIVNCSLQRLRRIVKHNIDEFVTVFGPGIEVDPVGRQMGFDG